MFEKLFKRKKQEVKEEVKEVKEVLSEEDREILEEKRQADMINKKISELDQETVKKIETRIREEFTREITVDPSNKQEYFDELDDAKEDLLIEVIREKKDPVMNALEREIIAKIFEETLNSSGYTLDEFNSWLNEEMDSEDELDDEEEMEDTPRYSR